MIGPAPVGGEVPVIRAVEPGHVAIEEQEMGARPMQVLVDVILLRHGGSFPVVEEPNGSGRPANRAQPDLIARTSLVDVLVQAIMEQVKSVAASTIRGTDPDGASG